MKHILNEGSFGPGDIPRYFRLVFPFHHPNHPKWSEKTAKQLQNGQLIGVKGIGHEGNLVLSFLGINISYNAVLVMPSDQVIKLNKISRILYDNPDYIASNNFSALIRMMGDSGKSEENDIHQTTTTLKDIIENLIKGLIYNALEKDEPTYSFNYGELMAYDYHKIIQDIVEKCEQKPIKNVHDLAKHIKTTIETESEGQTLPVDIEKTVKELNKIITQRSTWYKKEKEWILKDQKLIIPPDSRLYLLLDNPNYIDEEQAQKSQEKGLNDLMKYGVLDKYKTTYIDYDKYVSQREEIKKRRFKAASKNKNIEECIIPHQDIIGILMDSEGISRG